MVRRRARDGARDRRQAQRTQTGNAGAVLRAGDALIVLAANTGADRTPAWWLNLRDAGSGEVLIGRRRVRVRPRVLAGAERDRLWRAFVDMYPQAEHYTRFTTRGLPLTALQPERT